MTDALDSLNDHNDTHETTWRHLRRKVHEFRERHVYHGEHDNKEVPPCED